MDILLKGGFFIWPIVIESILALWVIIERCIYIFTLLPERKKSLAVLIESVKGNGENNPALPSHLLGRAIEKAKSEGVLNVSLLRLQADKLVDEAEKYLSILNIVAQSAPLLGLLGTVTGMIQAFIRIQALGGQVNASDLAGGIWEALITTAAGLIVAIPSLIAYIAFSRVVDRYSSEIDAAVSEIGHRMSRSGIEVV